MTSIQNRDTVIVEKAGKLSPIYILNYFSCSIGNIGNMPACVDSIPMVSLERLLHLSSNSQIYDCRSGSHVVVVVILHSHWPWDSCSPLTYLPSYLSKQAISKFDFV